MAFRIKDNVTALKLNRQIEKASKKQTNSLERLSSGQVFTKAEPRPAERALAEGLEYRLRALNASKRSMNDAVSLLQTAEQGLSQINNMMTRMKELNVAAASSTMSDRERKFLFVEYEALYNEINRVANVTTFNGVPLLNGENDATPEEMVFRLDDPFMVDDENINNIVFEGMEDVVATTEGLGLRSAMDLLEDLEDYEGIELEDAQELLEPDDDDEYTDVYQQAQTRLAQHRSVFGALQERVNRALEYNDVYAENIAAAKSTLADTDYAKEVTELTQSNILLQANTALMAQVNFENSIALGLLSSLK